MRTTTSPGMRRMIAKTITLTSASVGTASARRRRTYCLISPVEPRVHEPWPQAEAVVILHPLHRRHVADVLRRERRVHVVGLVGQVALDVVHDGQPLLEVHLAALGDQHLVQLG